MDQSNIFLDENTPKVYLRLSLPLVLSMAVTLIYNLADTFFVAQTGNTELIAGVSLCAPVFTFLMAIGNIFGQGGSSLISRLIGQNDTEASKRTSSFCFYAAILAGILIGAIMLIFRGFFLNLLGSDSMTLDYASDYYTPLIIGTPFVMLSFIHSNLLRSEGMAKESMTGTISGALVNIILDPLLISTFGYGAAGAAIATVVGYAVSDIYFLIIVIRKSRVLSASPAKASIASSSIFGAQPLFGYYFGSGDRKKLRALLRFTLLFILAAACLLTVSIIIFSSSLMKVFVDDSGMIAEGSLMLRLQVVTMPLVGLILLLMIIFQSAGKALGSFILSISRQGIIFFIVLAILCRVAGYTGIILSQAAADIITAVIAAILFRLQIMKEFR